MNHRMTVRAYDGEFIQLNWTTFRWRVTERVMDMRTVLSNLGICGLEVKAATRQLAPQETLCYR